MKIIVNSDEEMQAFGEKIGRVLRGGEVIELIGDVGAGKTTLTKGVARGLGVAEVVQSPTFTISRQYDARDGLLLAHYDFYRLTDAGIMTSELHETIALPHAVTVIEWSAIVNGVLPPDRLVITIGLTGETGRSVTVEGGGEQSAAVAGELS